MIKKIITLTLAVISISTSLTAFSQTTQKLTATKINEYGLIYRLPSTEASVIITTRRTVCRPGEFYRYAKKYLGIDPITEPSTVYTLDNVIVDTHGVANDDESYLVQFKAGSTPFMILNDQSFPLSINTEETNMGEAPQIPTSQPAEPTILETPIASQAVTAEMLQSPSSAKRAELAAARIFELRQSRNEIISGTAENMPSDGQAMQLALDNLAAQEAALTAMFVGTTQQSTEVKILNIEIPEDIADSRTTVIARLSTLDGLVDADNLCGDPISLTIKVTQRGELPKNEKGETKRFPKGGLAYCIPGSAQLTTEFMGRQMSDNIFEVAQYGVVFGIDPGLFTDKKAPAYATFNPNTGSLIELGTKQ